MPNVEAAISALLSEFRVNSWFTGTFWPENEYRIRLMLADLLRECPPPARLFDVGCAFGYITFLCARLGYDVTATDAMYVPETADLFARNGIKFLPSNLNHLAPFPTVADAAFEAALMGEVIEHILNHPLGLMRSVARVLKVGAPVVVTTPNPTTIMQAVRTVRGTAALWGAQSFIDEAKISGDGKIVELGDVHYHEFLPSELRGLLERACFEVVRVDYFGQGIGGSQSRLKRAVKSNPIMRRLMRRRPFASNQYILGRKII